MFQVLCLVGAILPSLALGYDRSKFGLEVYHPLDEIKSYIKTLADSDPQKVTLSSIGKSAEGRDIPLLTISTGSPNIVVFECGIHAREWIAISSCLWFMDRLLHEDSRHLASNSFQFIPVLNPDGYVYSWEKDRSWRKNRAQDKTGNGTCFGVDLNRNFGVDFCHMGASKNPCEDDYCGPQAYSEPESVALKKYVESLRGKIKAYFALHNYSQLWMYPFSHSHRLGPNERFLKKLAKTATRKIYETNGIVYGYGPVAEVLFKSSGSTIDWVYDEAKVKIVFAIELRDRGEKGFMMPESDIQPTATEVWNGIKGVLDEIK